MSNSLNIPSLNAQLSLSENIDDEIEKIISQTTLTRSNIEELVFSLLDLTSLEGNDTINKIQSMVDKAVKLDSILSKNIAAICVYPTFAKLVGRQLKPTKIQTASVAGSFPSGQSSIDIKLQEIEWAISQGANEIDMVISRGKLLEGKYVEVFDEIKAIKKVCGDTHLKVILETGELKTLENIRIASDIAIYAGADFIKTSTGKISEGATLKSVYVMLLAIKDYYQKTGKKIGIKPSGGIREFEHALEYLKLTQHILGEEWLTPDLFRFGASSLANNVLNNISVNTQNNSLKNYF